MHESEQHPRDATERLDGHRPTAALVTAIGDFAPVWFRWLRGRLPVGEATWSQIRVLSVLEQNGPETMGALAAALDVTPRNITAIVDGLESAGHVRRTGDASDRRTKRIVLTPSGEQYCAALLPRWLDDIGAAFDVLDERDQVELLRILRTLTRELPHRPDRPVGPADELEDTR